MLFTTKQILPDINVELFPPMSLCSTERRQPEKYFVAHFVNPSYEFKNLSEIPPHSLLLQILTDKVFLRGTFTFNTWNLEPTTLYFLNETNTH